ncbi:MAG TPA: hypothetical protein VFW33_20540 [Gemmataceae bacterium]|nr:hypothetical protein [Gemmataceae bacterium]
MPFLALACCAPSARASCGDYVITRGSHPADMAMTGHRADVPSSVPMAPHKPCHGPNCSRGPTVPQPLSAPTVTPPVSSEWGWLSAITLPAPPHAGASLGDPPAPHPIHLASGIFHPPRAA